MDVIPCRYSYRPSRRMAVRSAIICVFFGSLAFVADRPGAVFLAYTTICGLPAMLGFLGLGEYIFARRFIELGDTAIVFPDGFLRRDRKCISYAEIDVMWERPFENSVILHIGGSANSGKIFAEMLPDAASYKAMRDFVYSCATSLRIRYDQHDPPVEMTWKWEEFPKPILSWIEPKNYPRYRSDLVTRTALWRRAGRSVLFSVIWVLSGYILLGLLSLSASGFLAVALLFAPFLSFVDWMCFRYPARCSRVSLYEEKIGFVSGKQSGSTKYSEIRGWRIVERLDGGSIIHFLVIQYPKRILTWALPDEETREEAAQILSEKLGLRLDELVPEWE